MFDILRQSQHRPRIVRPHCRAQVAAAAIGCGWRQHSAVMSSSKAWDRPRAKCSERPVYGTRAPRLTSRRKQRISAYVAQLRRLPAGCTSYADAQVERERRHRGGGLRRRKTRRAHGGGDAFVRARCDAIITPAPRAP